MKLALFDLDHTLLDGDSDVLWCVFLLKNGLVDTATFAQRNADMERRYQAGEVSPAEFCSFFVSTLAGRSLDFWEPWRQLFLRDIVLPRVPEAAHALIKWHRSRGDTLVMTTATNRYITELTAAALGFEHLIATECELMDGAFTGRTCQTLNMREGKVLRLQQWLAQQGLDGDLLQQAVFYSDSINDLALLQSVAEPVTVNPDPKLAAHAARAGWRLLMLHDHT